MCSPNLLYRLPDRLLHLELAEFASNSQSSRPGGFTPWSSRGGKRRTCRVTCIWRKRSGRCCTPERRRRRHRTSRRRCGKPSGELLLWEGFLGARGTGTSALLRRGAVWNVCPPWSKGGNSTRPCTPPAPALVVRCQAWVRVSPTRRGETELQYCATRELRS